MEVLLTPVQCAYIFATTSAVVACGESPEFLFPATTTFCLLLNNRVGFIGATAVSFLVAEATSLLVQNTDLKRRIQPFKDFRDAHKSILLIASLSCFPLIGFLESN